MYAAEGCDSSRDAQPSTYRHVISALFSCHGKINPLFPNPKSLPSIVVAQFIGRLCLMNQTTTQIWRRGKLMGKTFKIALVPVPIGAMLDGVP